MSNAGADFLRPVDESQPGSISDQVFTMLYQAIIRLDLKPGEKLSEIAIAKQVGLSRQPVREAFQRLAAVGFLSIRPQRATVVTLSRSRCCIMHSLSAVPSNWPPCAPQLRRPRPLILKRSRKTSIGSNRPWKRAARKISISLIMNSTSESRRRVGMAICGRSSVFTRLMVTG